MNKRKTIVCPYCFEEFAIKQLNFECINKRCKSFGNAFQISSNNKFEDRFNDVCPDCGQRSYKVVCPNCKNHLPESTLNGDDMIISVIGARDTGKSNYIGVLIHEFLGRVAPAFNGSFIGFDKSLEEYNRRFGDTLYKAKVRIAQTETALNRADNPLPLIFTLSLTHKSFFSSKINKYTFVFYDTAGEDLEDFETTSTVAKYICKSKGIIFLLDPLKIGDVENQLDNVMVQRASSTSDVTSSAEIMNNASELIRNDKKILSTTKIDIPVAVVFSKFDVIDSIVPDGATVKNNSPHCKNGAFSASDIETVNNEVRGLLDAWNDRELIAFIDNNYNRHAFFCSSAFGLNNNAELGSGKINTPNPHRIEDAFLWILAENGVIPKK